jgi:hypothetical protein
LPRKGQNKNNTTELLFSGPGMFWKNISQVNLYLVGKRFTFELFFSPARFEFKISFKIKDLIISLE